ncbi:MAG: hypothetical protein ACO29X_05170 [Arcobacteraceae bacterium]|jgi:hypothetical protein
MYHYKKIVFFILLIGQNIFGSSFETNCLECHFAKEQLKMFLERYEEKYGSENDVKKAIFKYMKNPKKENSIMPSGFLKRFGVKEKSNLNDIALKKAIDIYYDTYNIKKKIK